MVGVRVKLRHSALAGTVVLGLVVAGCGDDGPDATPSTSLSPETTVSSTSSSTTSTSLSAEDALLAETFDAYVDATQVFIEIAEHPDPSDPRIPATTTSVMLQNRLEHLGGLRANGQAIVYPADPIFQIEYIDGTFEQREDDIVVFEVCIVDDGWTQDVATGEPSTGGVSSVEATVAMVREDGTWKLAEQLYENRVAGVAGCAESWE